MMASLDRVTITLEVRPGISLPILRAMSGVMDAIVARDSLALTIELRALDALQEIRRMGDEARAALGIR